MTKNDRCHHCIYYFSTREDSDPGCQIVCFGLRCVEGSEFSPTKAYMEVDGDGTI